jgi:hypothetical protein
MITKRDKQQLAVFLPLVLAIGGALGLELVLTHFFGQVQALRAIAVGSLIGVLVQSKQLIALNREVRKMRQADNNRTV